MMNQYSNMTDVSGMGNGMQDTRSQDALHQALLLRTSQMNPQTQPSSQNNNMLAQILRQGSQPTSSTNKNPANVYDYSTPISGGDFSMSDYLGQLGLGGGGEFSGAGSFDLGSILGDGSAIGGGIGDFFASLFGGGGALAGAGDVLAEAAPLILAA